MTNSCKTSETLVLLGAMVLVSIVLEEAFLRWEVVVPTEFAAEGGRSIPWFGSFHANREGESVGRSLVGCGCYGISVLPEERDEREDWGLLRAA